MIFINIELYNADLSVYEMMELNIFQIVRMYPIVKNDIDKGTHIACDDGILHIAKEPIDKIMLKINDRKEDLMNSLIANLMVQMKKPKTRKRRK